MPLSISFVKLENIGSNKLTLVQNEQDIDLKVNISIGTSTENNLPPFEIHGHGMEKVNIALSGDKSTKVTLDAGNGGCELRPEKSKEENDPKDVNDSSKSKDGSKDVEDPSKSKEVNDPSKLKEVDDPSKSIDKTDPLPKPTIFDTPISQINILDQLMFYSKQVTPIFGAYFAFLVTLIIGASWALCSFRKRRTDNGVPYQELEMGLPESSNEVNVETGVEGWDQDWDDDDDWDEDKAIKSPAGGGIHSKSISSNGLTSRPTKKDDWDANWDD
ncbi:uncharacterized protein [Rutidosis leptorrhynchoides]|uniref:uncharacterized protein n=1 Tax=Rutidosis leptorrhynchoides TaxID=125765 RepID=UPI003A9A0874